MRILPGSLVLAAALAASGVGCTPANYTAPERYERGLVVVMSGAGDIMGEVNSIRGGLDAGGVKHALEEFRWSRGEVLTDQTGVEHNRRMAQRLARRIEAYERQYPGRPVHLVGVSAGTGIAMWTLEAMAPEAMVTGAVLISSSLQAQYDLTRAMSHIRGKLYSFYSPMDVILSAGVTITGTVDRSGNVAGGLFGFSAPEGATEATRRLYKDRLVQTGWGPGDVLLGHVGDHLGATRSGFVRERIAPLILGRKPAAKPAKGAKAAAGAGPKRDGDTYR